ncbi:hypothetical protein METBIDRAFT_36510 [Metschnikowia bicuspidata var. bicuspidata NRRL YB-4993]|uniref:Golgi to ER traffic protein 1 n=1 Tax=Metschnikowia bicuspidata var. bicuspidata NRRL YB-4993 TaxID=869754 RepID=A0A1A0HJZ1_9ASCO|nr:hypothetical protein METBIDRAFT_36510 [Metschnikowia bicuspidata var. bicuspidata NRRL YB-4993]OBA24128.1 hypothetical protein METBIDRAFT_36510 [Metschnikowia bicuspidata var. bicuspidata NRRL YB-4993]
MSFLDLLPTTILAFIFTVLLAKHVVSAIGKSTLVENAWSIYTWLASRMGHPKFKLLAAKRQELVKVNRERKAISAQDQYARWTKLNRTFDKLSGEISALTEEVSAEKASVGKVVNLTITVFTTAPIWFSRYWYRKVVLLYFPAGVFPYPVEWFLALPFTVTGGLGLTVWMFAVNSVLSSLTFLVKYALEPAVEKPELVSGEGKNNGQKTTDTEETAQL